jgi:hypothetical protein
MADRDDDVRQELSPEELETEDVSALPDREAMSVVTGSSGLAIPEPVPVYDEAPGPIPILADDKASPAPIDQPAATDQPTLDV